MFIGATKRGRKTSQFNDPLRSDKRKALPVPNKLLNEAKFDTKSYYYFTEIASTLERTE